MGLEGVLGSLWGHMCDWMRSLRGRVQLMRQGGLKLEEKHTYRETERLITVSILGVWL